MGGEWSLSQIDRLEKSPVYLFKHTHSVGPQSQSEWGVEQKRPRTHRESNLEPMVVCLISYNHCSGGAA